MKAAKESCHMYFDEFVSMMGVLIFLVGFILYGISERKHVAKHGLYKSVFMKRDTDDLPMFRRSLIIMLLGFLFVLSSGLIKFNFPRYNFYF